MKKNVVLAIAASLTVIALRVAAQTTPDPAYNTTDPKSSTGMSATGAVPDERTNAATPTHSEDPGLTATGTVISWNDDEVVLNTSTGPMHIKLLPATTGTRTFTEGQSISVDFTRNEQGVLLGKQIRSVGETTPEVAEAAVPAPAPVTEPAPAPAPVESVATQPKEEVPEAAVNTKESLNPPVTTPPANLPATASNSPLVALLGLLALAGGVALRRR